jgi:hypothetical protein
MQRVPDHEAAARSEGIAGFSQADPLAASLDLLIDEVWSPMRVRLSQQVIV